MARPRGSASNGLERPGRLLAIKGPSTLWTPDRWDDDAGMEFAVVFTTVILFALLLATGAGFVAARILMHAADTGAARGGRSDDR